MEVLLYFDPTPFQDFTLNVKVYNWYYIHAGREYKHVKHVHQTITFIKILGPFFTKYR